VFGGLAYHSILKTEQVISLDVVLLSSLEMMMIMDHTFAVY